MGNAKSGFGTVAVWLAVAVVAIALLCMLATHLAGWSAWALIGISAIITVAIFLGLITGQAHFSMLFGTIGALIVVIALVLKGCAA